MYDCQNCPRVLREKIHHQHSFSKTNRYLDITCGHSLVVQGLATLVATLVASSTLGQGTKILQATLHSQKQTNKLIALKKKKDVTYGHSVVYETEMHFKTLTFQYYFYLLTLELCYMWVLSVTLAGNQHNSLLTDAWKIDILSFFSSLQPVYLNSNCIEPQHFLFSTINFPLETVILLF